MEEISLHWTDHLLFLILGVMIPLATGPGARSALKEMEFDARLKRAMYFGNSFFLALLAAAVLLVWWINGRSLASLGLVWPPPNWDGISIAVLLVFVLLYLIDSIGEIYPKDKLEKTRTRFRDELGFLPANLHEYSQYIVLALSAGIFEEIVFRGYFIRYLQLLFGYTDSTNTMAILLAALIFGLVHLYQGWRAGIKVTAMAIMFGFIFVRVESLFWLMVIHAAVDLIGGAVAWYLLQNEQEELE